MTFLRSHSPRSTRAAAVIAGALLLSIASYLEIPMVPVPVTMQTLAVTVIGALYGWRLALVTITAWLIAAASGLPVLSGGSSGTDSFTGPTAGYLFAFPIAGAVVGWLVERGWNSGKPHLLFAAMIIGNIICLFLGAAWLTSMIGVEEAILKGVAPFLIGAFLKSALGAVIVKLVSAKLQTE